MISNTIIELEKAFDFFNKEFYEDKLIKPIILVQSAKKRNSLGTCSCGPIWENKDDKTKNNYEITISAEFLNRTLDEILATLLHEMVHLYCSQNEIKDTSNNCVYHNKKFKEEAEKRGLIINHEKTIGWSVTKLNEATIDLIKKCSINDKVFDYYRNSCLGPAKKLSKPMFKYSCPECGLKISHYKEVKLICGNCNVELESR
jgi:hypothetical protein